jgi:hypothetical protein
MPRFDPRRRHDGVARVCQCDGTAAQRLEREKDDERNPFQRGS